MGTTALCRLATVCLGFLVARTYAGHVLDMTSDNFYHYITAHEVVLVDFMSPWCGQCRKLAPSFAAAADKLSSINGTVRLGQVDAEAHPDLAKQFAVRKFPTFLIFAHGHAMPFDYLGLQSTKGFVQEMMSWRPPSEFVRELADDDIDAFISQEELLMVKFCEYLRDAQHL